MNFLRSSYRGSPVARVLAACIVALLAHACTPEPETKTDLTVPNPVIQPSAKLTYTENNKNYVRYEYEVTNRGSFPPELFAPAPDLPPCGINKNSSRSWLDIYDQNGARLYGFCALAKPAELAKIWFAVEESATHPTSVYIEIEDRQTKKKYKSNLAPVMP